MALSLLANARTCAARLLDRRAHTAHSQPTAIVGPVSTALGSYHGCNPSTVCPSDRYTPHPCVLAAHHILHARPPDASGCAFVSDTYYSLELRSSPSVWNCLEDHRHAHPLEQYIVVGWIGVSPHFVTLWLCVRGNGIIHRVQKAILPDSLLSGTLPSYGASAVARTSDRGRVAEV